MAAKTRAANVKFLTPRERLGLRILFQSKLRLSLILTLIVLPIALPSGVAYWLYTRNQALMSSTREVVVELEILDQEIEKLSRRAGLPRVRSEGISMDALSSIPSGQGGVPIEIQPEQQLALARRLLPALTRQLTTKTKPALEETLKEEERISKEEERISKATPTGNPVKGAFEMSSDFGIRPNPYGGGYEGHDGVDLLGDYGTPIYATAGGNAERAHYGGGYGYHVLIKNSQGYETLYAHLSKLAVQPGQEIQQGQLVGYMGSTGRSTGTHLHYSIYYWGKAIDPKPYMAPGWTYSAAFR
ncbi:MAG: M23 family metallopeptidase [Cyanobacteria bacterium P01_F01_bin.42]